MTGGFGFGSAKTGRKRFFRRNRGFKALSERVLQRTGLLFRKKRPDSSEKYFRNDPVLFRLFSIA